MLFNIVIHKDSDSDYGISVPELPGCFSAGSSLEEALAGAKEAIECHIEGLMQDGEPVPAPGILEDSLADVEQPYQLGVVDVNMDELSSDKERVNISAPKIVLRTIDKAAGAAGKTRSAFLVEAGMEAARKTHPVN